MAMMHSLQNPSDPSARFLQPGILHFGRFASADARAFGVWGDALVDCLFGFGAIISPFSLCVFLTQELQRGGPRRPGDHQLR